MSNLSKMADRARRGLGPLLQVCVVIVLAWIVARASVDPDTIREAARPGALDALRTASASLPANAPASLTDPVPVQTAAPVSLTVRTADRRGRADAPISIVEFADFQCPYCQKFFNETETALIQRYVQSGQATFSYKHLAILGDESTWAAEAAECAADQGQFWAYHDLLFQKQAGENQGVFTKEKLIAFAQALNLDLTTFTTCLQTDAPLARVQADLAEGEAAQVDGTPTFFINGQRLVGAQPLTSFEALIQQLLPH